MEMANVVDNKNVYMPKPMPTCKLGYIFHVIRWQTPQTLVGKGA
jgi:hypothetical protein